MRITLTRKRILGRAIRLCVWPALLLAAAASGAQARQSAAGQFNGNLFDAAPRQQQQQSQQQPEEDDDEVVPSRPGVANSAGIPKPGVLQLEVGYDSNFRSREVRAEHAAELTLRYSVAKRLLLHADVDAVDSETDALTRERATGVGDTRVGFQVVARDGGEKHPSLAFAYFVKLPTADESKGLGTGRFDHKVVGLLSWKAGETDVDFNVAYLLVGKEGEPGREHGGQGALSVSHDFKNHFGVEGEVSGQSHDDVQPRGVFALGALEYKASPRLVFDAGARFGLNPEAPRVGFFAGLTVGVTRAKKR